MTDYDREKYDVFIKGCVITKLNGVVVITLPENGHAGVFENHVDYNHDKVVRLRLETHDGKSVWEL